MTDEMFKLWMKELEDRHHACSVCVMVAPTARPQVTSCRTTSGDLTWLCSSTALTPAGVSCEHVGRGTTWFQAVKHWRRLGRCQEGAPLPCHLGQD
jgi:hypothetical protein